MPKKKNIKNFFFIFVTALFFSSCGPKIYYFKSDKTSISQGDSIKLQWKTRGKPILKFHEKTSADDPANIKPGERLMEFILGFDHSIISQNTRVIVTPKETSDTLFIITSKIQGDTLIASDTKLPEDLFTISSVTSVMNRVIIVWHANKKIVLPANKSTSFEFNNTPIGGMWKIETLLSAAEKKNPATAPTILKILINKKHK